MALIKCKECEKEISSEAVNCPSCGAPVKPTKKKGGFLNFLKKMVITWLVIVAVFYAGFLYIQNVMEENRIQAEKTKAEDAQKAKLKAIEDKKKAEEAAKLKVIEDKKKAEEAAAKAKAEAEELEKNLENAEYLSDKFGIFAGVACRRPVENQAKFSFEWTDGFLDSKFPSYLVKTIAPGVLTVTGSKIKFQNAFGAMRFMKYQCDYDVKNKKVLLPVRVAEK